MPAQNRYAFLLSEKGDVAKNVNDIYAQLQAPAQRSAVNAELSNAINRTSVETVPNYDANGFFLGDSAVYTPNPITEYGTAVKTANRAASRTLINPKDIVSAYSKENGSELPTLNRNITNAYINPVAEGAYETSPLFDWQGRTVAGPGANPPAKGTAADARMYELRYGRDVQKTNYDKTIDKIQDNAAFQQNLNSLAYEQQRYRPAPTSLSNGYENQYTALDRDRHGSDPDFSYRLQQSGRVDLPDYNRAFFMQQTAAREQAQVNAYQASQTGLSQSFYRGGHDKESSFPSGYRL